MIRRNTHCLQKTSQFIYMSTIFTCHNVLFEQHLKALAFKWKSDFTNEKIWKEICKRGLSLFMYKNLLSPHFEFSWHNLVRKVLYCIFVLNTVTLPPFRALYIWAPALRVIIILLSYSILLVSLLCSNAYSGCLLCYYMAIFIWIRQLVLDATLQIHFTPDKRCLQ